ncbi:MAG: serine hydrolase, partial [Gemmatimonadetes bacterium]|nr:serine hydrolase [Gemmatimonadota bacterium]
TPDGKNSGGHLLSSPAFGHTGFTGTSLWIDPESNLFILLLSNRVNPTRERTGIAAVRVALVDAVLSVVGRGAAQPPPDASGRRGLQHREKPWSRPALRSPTPRPTSKTEEAPR